MHRIAANYIFPIASKPIKNGVIEVDAAGAIHRIIDPGGASPPEMPSMEFHNGVLVPGFVNAHCHLELSHLKGLFGEGLGLSKFVEQIGDLRNTDPETIDHALADAIRLLEGNGTVAVADICNTTDSIPRKAISKLHFHNFVEVYGISPGRAELLAARALSLLDEFEEAFPKSSSLTPHSTYSLSKNLWSKLNDHFNAPGNTLSIHYGESADEYEFLASSSGPLFQRYQKLGLPFDPPANQTPHSVVLGNISPSQRVLFIHNTYAPREEIQALASHFTDCHFVLCPTSNLFIENRLPDVLGLRSASPSIALGTDSYASSRTLSVFDQIAILLDRFPQIAFAEVIKWATLNGAKALGIDSRFGSFEVGKQPGINLITHFDFERMRPRPSSQVRRLI
jgi:cytosine/adenosine deaminase-related metal-dependent hydrolase